MNQRFKYFVIWPAWCNFKWKQRKFCIPGKVCVKWHYNVLFWWFCRSENVKKVRHLHTKQSIRRINYCKIDCSSSKLRNITIGNLISKKCMDLNMHDEYEFYWCSININMKIPIKLRLMTILNQIIFVIILRTLTQSSCDHVFSFTASWFYLGYECKSNLQ